MLLESIVIPKNSMTIVNESQTLAEALEILEVTENRCLPVLDDANRIFRGNIYKMHIYRHQASGGEMSLPVTFLLKNATKFIFLDASYFDILFTMRDLPYIAVLNQKKEFVGVLTHEKMLDVLHEFWAVDQSGYILTLQTNGKQTDLALITKIISKYSFILNLITLNTVPHSMKQEILITLPRNILPSNKEKILNRLQKKGFALLDLENLVDDLDAQFTS